MTLPIATAMWRQYLGHEPSQSTYPFMATASLMDHTNPSSLKGFSFNGNCLLGWSLCQGRSSLGNAVTRLWLGCARALGEMHLLNGLYSHSLLTSTTASEPCALGIPQALYYLTSVSSPRRSLLLESPYPAVCIPDCPVSGTSSPRLSWVLQISASILHLNPR